MVGKVEENERCTKSNGMFDQENQKETKQEIHRVQTESIETEEKAQGPQTSCSKEKKAESEQENRKNPTWC